MSEGTSQAFIRIHVAEQDQLGEQQQEQAKKLGIAINICFRNCYVYIHG